MKKTMLLLSVFCWMIFVAPLSGCQRETTTTSSAITSLVDRKAVGSVDWVFPDYRNQQIDFPNTVLGRTRTSLQFSFQDPERAVQSVKLVMLEINTLRECETLIYPVGSYRDEAGYATISNVFITGLAPGVDYRFIVYASGFDGYETFTDKQIGEHDFTSDAYDGMVDSTHDVYAYVLNKHITYLGYSVLVYFFASEESLLSTTPETQSFVLRVRDEFGAIVYEEPLEANGETTFFIENALLGFDHIITVENSSGDIVLCRQNIEVEDPFFSLTVDQTTNPFMMNFDWYDGVGVQITGVYLEVIVNDTVYQLYERPEGSTVRSAVIELPDDFSNEDQLKVHVRITYSAFGGFATDMVNYVYWRPL